MASTSNIIVEITGNQGDNSFYLTPAPSYTHHKSRGPHLHSYDVFNVKSLTSGSKTLNVAAAYNQPASYEDQDVPPIYAHRFITGYGMDDGGVTCLIHSSLSINQTILYMDILPWFTRVFLKSLVIENNGFKVPYRVHFMPAKERGRPYQLELSFNLWPHSITSISFSFKRAFLKWTEYPPDANHGFYISSAVITAMVGSSSHHTSPLLTSSRIDSIFHEQNETRYPVQVHTESLLVSLPTPDFSMPYNVICLACTVVAIAFGSIHNLTTRRFVKHDPLKKKGLLSKIKAFVFKDKTKGLKSDTVETKEQVADETNEGVESMGEDVDAKEKDSAKSS